MTSIDPELVLLLWPLTGIVIYFLCLSLKQEGTHVNADLLNFFIYMTAGPLTVVALVLVLWGFSEVQIMKTFYLIKRSAQGCRTYYFKNILPTYKIPLYINKVKPDMKKILMNRLEKR